MIHGLRLPFFCLKWIPIHQLTPNLCFNIPFHLYIHDFVLDEIIATLTSGVNTYVPRYSFMVFSYLFLAQTDTNPSTNSKSMFQHSFPPLHSWSRLRRTNRYSYQWGEHIRTPDIGKLLCSMVYGYLFFLPKTDTIHQLTPNLFQHSFPPLHSWSHLRRTNRYIYQWDEHICTPEYRQTAIFNGLRFLPETDTNPPTDPNSVSTFLSTSTFMISS